MSFSGSHAIAHGDVLSILKELPSNEFDALLCDPPYGFSFMGKKWDYDVPSVEVWREALRVLKPGAPLVSFGGTRTYHRVAVNIEDAGFELRDCLSWMYGSGFPKSLDVSKALDKSAGAERTQVIGTKLGRPGMSKDGSNQRSGFDAAFGGEASGGMSTDITAPATDAARLWHGYGTALKPAWEPAILGRKPLDGTVANNVAKWGVGGLAIDACRIAGDKPSPVFGGTKGGNAYGHSEQYQYNPSDIGRWPANVALDEEAAAILDAQTGTLTSGARVASKTGKKSGSMAGALAYNGGACSADSGGASRFFYCAKVSTREREHGCSALPHRSPAEMTDSEEGQARLESPRTGAGRGGGARNHHPTLKPIALAKWLAAMIKPPTDNAALLVPFSGAGSEIIGALEAGWPMVFGIEGEAEYIEIANARIAAWSKGTP